MDVYFIEKDKFLNSIDRKYLESFSDNRKYKSEEKYLEHLCGLFIIKYVAKNFYNIEKPEINYVNKKPYINSNELSISVSHSENIVMVAFEKTNIGIDIEFMKDKDYSKIFKRYNIEKENPTKEEFYEFWTQKEAEIKLGKKNNYTINKILFDNYMFCTVSEEKFEHLNFHNIETKLSF